MTTTLRTRVQLVLVSTSVAALAAVLWLRSRDKGSIRLVDNRRTVDALLEERAGKGATAATGGALVREPIDETRANLLWTIEPAYYDYDPACYYRHKGGLVIDAAWPEHPLGHYETRTSLDGYREDFERVPSVRDLLVLVTGDSHTDGLCFNAESFANRVEQELAERRPGRAVEVLNAGVSGYSFYNHLGVLERDLGLEPDAFVVAVYGGNDFLDVVKPWHYFHRTTPPERTKEYWKKLTEASRANPVLLGNAFNQLYYFRSFPDQIEVSLSACAETTGEIDRLCKERGIEVVYVFIPVGFPTSGALPADVAHARSVLGLSDADLLQYDRVADRFLDLLRARGHVPIDLRAHFTQPIRSYYWSDLHINLAGHALVAELLRPRIEAAIPADR